MTAQLEEPISAGVNETAKPAEERTAKGQYAKGNRGGPGNPFNRQIAAFRKMIVGTTTEDDVREATRKLIEMAREGNLAAIKLFFQYVVGRRPTRSIRTGSMSTNGSSTSSRTSAASRARRCSWTACRSRLRRCSPPSWRWRNART